ncbi:MAG: permease YjgP/YjgQ family protein [Deltaproteobacteria bacterium]|nr:permease YjgP/YjgQ family protein [Deltaproteobacteria bacterium]
MKLTLHKYIFHEIWPTLLASLAVFLFIVLAARMLNLAEWMVNHGVHPFQLAKMIFYLLPGMILLALPAVLLMAVFGAFHRLSNDNELQAMEASGISLYQMLPSVVLISLAGFLAALFLSSSAGPWGIKSFKDFVFTIAYSRADLGIQERVFSDPFKGVTFFVSKERLMKDVFLVDRRNPDITTTIVAKEGRIDSREELRLITVRFFDGTIFVVDKKQEEGRTVTFSTYDLGIGLDDIMPVLAGREKDPKEMSFEELMNGLRAPPKPNSKQAEILLEVMERFSIPFAVFLMGLIGAPLGAQLRAGGRLVGIVVSLLIFLSYYLMLVGMRNIGGTGFLSPAVGSWIPVLFLFCACLYLMKRSEKEKSVALFEELLRVRDHT